LEAADAVFSLERARGLAGTRASGYLVAVESVRALDRFTLEVVTRHPYALLLNKLAFVFLVPRGSPDEIAEPVGTGPYRIAGRTPEAVSLRAFDGYWGAPPSLPQAELRSLPDRTARLARLLSGELDLATRLTPDDLPRVRSSGSARAVSGASLMVVFLQARVDAPPLDDVRVRRAIHLALDRRALVRDLLKEAGTAAAQMVGRRVFGAIPELPEPASDPEAARALLRAAGHPRGVELTLEFREGIDLLPLQEQLARAGIRLTLRPSPWSTLYPRVAAGEVPLFLGGWISSPGDASDVLDSMAHSPDPARGYGDANWSGLRDPALDRLIEQAGEAWDVVERQHRLQRALRALNETHALIPLYAPDDLYGVAADVVWKPRLDGRLLLREAALRN
jgi:peptide/nickel transport system substrate-binding protein